MNFIGPLSLVNRLQRFACVGHAIEPTWKTFDRYGAPFVDTKREGAAVYSDVFDGVSCVHGRLQVKGAKSNSVGCVSGAGAGGQSLSFEVQASEHCEVVPKTSMFCGVVMNDNSLVENVG